MFHGKYCVAIIIVLYVILLLSLLSVESFLKLHKPHWQYYACYHWLLESFLKVYKPYCQLQHISTMSEYSLLDPTICGYYRSAVFRQIKSLIPVAERENVERSFIDNTFSLQDLLNTINENDFYILLWITRRTSPSMVKDAHDRLHQQKKPQTFIPMDEGFTQVVELFGTYYLQYDLFKKNIQRFKDANKKWSRVNAKKKNKYYEFFSPVNWQKLQYTEKVKHTKFCDGCAIKIIDIQASFPSTSIRFSNSRKENIVYVMCMK